GIGRDVEAQDLQLARIGGQQPGGQADERRLASPIRSDQGSERAVARLQGDAVQRWYNIAGVAAKRLADVAAEQDRWGASHRAHRCPSATGAAKDCGLC